MKDEVWKDIPGYEGFYMVSTLGRVKSLDRFALIKNSKKYIRGKLIKPGRSSGGYLQIHLYKNRKAEHFLLHRLVLLVFEGDPPPGCEGCHNDGVKTNCRLSNLRWDTKKNNHKDKVKHGTAGFGELAPSAKLKNGDVLMIRHLYDNENKTQSEIAELFNVSRPHVSEIVNRNQWTHI